MSLVILLAIIFLGSPAALSIWLWHACSAVFALLNLHRFGSYIWFWVFLLVNLLFAVEPRISLERYLMAMGFAAWALSPGWQNFRHKKTFLTVVFAIAFLQNIFGAEIIERGSLLLWLPVFYFVYYGSGEKQKSSALDYLFAALSFLSNKLSLALAWVLALLSRLKTKLLALLGAVFAIAVIFLANDYLHFVKKSLIARLYICLAGLKAYFAAPIFGHGFGSFAINIAPYRSYADTWGARASEQINHAHNLWLQLMTEQGLFGLCFLLLIFYVVYRLSKTGFVALLVLSLCDANLVSYSQYLLAALILLPKVKLDRFLSPFTKELPGFLIKPARVLLVIAALSFFTMSVTAHYFYDNDQFARAVKLDSQHPLYNFAYGYHFLDQDPELAQEYMKRAIELAPSIGYFYGCLGAAELSTNKLEAAKQNLERAIEYTGENPYWLLMLALANYRHEPELAKQQFESAKQIDEDIVRLLSEPESSSEWYIGGKLYDSRVPMFYRRGAKIHLPLPYLEKIPSAFND